MQSLASSRVARSHVACFRPMPARSARRSFTKVLAQQTGKRWDSEAETAAQVRRLIRRDKKEFLGADDILQRFEAEFEEGSTQAATQDSASSSTAAAAPAATTATETEAPSSSSASRPSLASRAAAVAAQQSGSPTSFKAAAPASPFGSPSVPSNPFGAPPPATSRNIMEPQGLSPSMSPDPLQPEKQTTFGSFIGGITLTQIVIVLSFSTIIGLMVATFTFVYNVGAIKLAGVD